jgi:universal stress protein E
MNSAGFILVGTDFSQASDEAVTQASRWAERESLPLLVCHALPQMVGSNPLFPERAALQQEVLTQLQPWALDRIDQQVRACTRRGPGAFEAVVAAGDPASVLLRVAEERSARGMVVGARSPADFGHTAERVVRYAHCTALLAKQTEPGGRVLVATDLSDRSLTAVNAGIQAARERGARLTLLHCLEWPGSPIIDSAMGMVWQPAVTEEMILDKRAGVLERLRQILEVAGADGEIRCETGWPAVTILRIAEEERCGLLVLGSHGHSGWMRVALGSVTEWVLRAAPASILVVRRSGGGHGSV